jgi:hypothetical protein
MKPYAGRVRNVQYVRRPATDTFSHRVSISSTLHCIRTPARSAAQLDSNHQTRIWPDKASTTGNSSKSDLVNFHLNWPTCSAVAKGYGSVHLHLRRI